MILPTVRRIGSRAARSLVRQWSDQLRLPGNAWLALQAELDRWHGLPVRFWWRDDDATRDTPQIRRMLDVSAGLGIPVAVAVIPATVCGSLATLLEGRPNVGVLSHGWSHRNLALPGRPDAELGPGRDAEKVFVELSDGRRRLEGLFGAQFLPVQVPPYNCLAPDLVPAVVRAGYEYISIDRDFTGLPILSRNIHIDVIDWGTGRAAEPASIVRDAVVALRLRRYGLVDATTAIGVMTHHLVHDREIWDITEHLLRILASHEAVAFPAISRIFPPIAS